MSGGGSLGLGIRSGSYGSLDKQLNININSNGNDSNNNNNNNNGVLPIQIPSRKAHKMFKDRDTLFHRICKLAGRKRVGMLLLSIISAAVFVWVLCVAKGGEEPNSTHFIEMNSTSAFSFSEYSPNYRDELSNLTSLSDLAGLNPSLVLPPPPPAVFLGYTLPPGHPCNNLAMPPPPADKKRTGPRPCPVCYLPVEEAIALMPKVPSYSPVLKHLTYIYEENLSRETEFGGSDFGGFPTLAQRDDSYNIRDSMSMHCGFVKGPKPGRNTGFDIDEVDLLSMDQCRGIVVASAIFGNFDDINQPKNISDYSKETVCFYMFIDEITEEYVKTTGAMDSNRKIGVWRVIVVRNLPYEDGRRTGKIPKLLMHRLFPNARFSLWVDGKLELVVDPYQVLERFLWRKNATFAISRHYKRFDVFVEAEANKVAGKYDNDSIDFQADFYRKEGLLPYTEEKLPITSDVPEGCVIIREHIPISNLFTCLWFNEVDRFTSRDQISFAIVRDKIRNRTNYTINMFLDCERRNFVVQKYHREVLEKLLAAQPPPAFPPPLILPPPLPPVNKPPMTALLETTPGINAINVPVRRVTTRRVRDRRSGNSRRHRKVGARIIDST